VVNGYVGDSPGSFIRSFRELAPPWDPTARDIGQDRAGGIVRDVSGTVVPPAIIAQQDRAALEEAALEEQYYDLLSPEWQNVVDDGYIDIVRNPATGEFSLEFPPFGPGELATPAMIEASFNRGAQESPDLQAIVDQYTSGLPEEMRLLIEQGAVTVRLDQYGVPYLDEGPIAGGVADLPAVVDQFTANLPAQMRGYIEAGIVTVRVDNNGLPFLAKGPLAGLLPERALDELLGVGPAPPPSMTPYQAAQTMMQQAQTMGYMGGTPTLARETMERANALELAGLLGYVPGGDGGDPTATLAAQLGYGGLGIQQQDVDLRRLLGMGGLGIQQQDLNLRQMLGLQGLGIQQQDVDLRRMLGLGGLDIDRQQLGLNRGELMGFYGGAPTLEAAQTLGSLWGQPTLQAELGRRELAIAEAAQQTEWLRNPSNFIAAQLLRGGPGATVGNVTIPGRVAETIYGGALPNPSQVGYGMFGPAQVAVPSLQTLNQLNPDEIQAVASAVPYLTGGAVTPNQFFGDAAYQGLRGY